MASHFSARTKSQSSPLSKRSLLRRVLVESLERREMLAADSAGVVFAGGTPQDYVDSVIDQYLAGTGADSSGEGSGGINLQGSRWVNPTGGLSPDMGDPSTVSWSIVPDGTIDSANGAATNLIAFMDSIYGGGTGPVEQRPWFGLFERAYDSWSETSGLTFVYEANDDGAPMGGTNRGVTGVRGDVRIGGRAIDGNNGVLAFNYFPNNSGNAGFDGDMIIDTNDVFYFNNADGPTGENRLLHNVLMHEAGHGIGLGHVIPVDQTKLMEPFISSAYFGAQHDDILGAQQLYGDNFENDDDLASAQDLGELSNGLTARDQLSIDKAGDDDWYEFSVASAGDVSITIVPQGEQYDVGPQGGTASPVDTLVNLDLSFELLASDGSQLAVVNAGGLGAPEALLDYTLPGAGTYYVKIVGAGDATAEPQLYSMELRASGLSSGFVGRQPRLLSVAPNSGEIFSFNNTTSLTEAPTELVFRFDGASDIDPATLAGGIRVIRAGGDGTFGDGNEEVVTPGYIGIGENDRIAVLRFANTLTDDLYRVEVIGEDDPDNGLTAITNSQGVPLLTRGIDSTPDDPTRDTVDFDLELGALVEAVVPQPVDRQPDGTLVAQRDKIRVYFNDDDLHTAAVTTGDLATDPTVVDPSYYQLVLTADTVEPGDDQVFMPTSISYDPATDVAELTFAQPIDQLAGAGTYRLRVGGNDEVVSQANPSALNNITPADPAGFMAGAFPLGIVTSGLSTVINQSIVTTSVDVLPLDFPGSILDIGHRDIQDEHHIHGGPDADPGIAKIAYNFALDRPYGNDAIGRPINTSITTDQIDRTREVFEFFSEYFGIDFVETQSDGLTVVVGDLFPLGDTQSGPGGVIGIAGGGLAIMDGAETWDNSFGGRSGIPGSQNFFETTMHEVGHLLGLGHTYDQPEGTIMGAEGDLANPNRGLSNSLEWVFPGDVDIIHGEHLYRPDNRDVDTYSFTVPAGQTATMVAETIAERLSDSSDLDTHLTLFKQTAGGFEVLASNDDNVSSDSFITAELEAGSYFLSVTGKGNEDFNPQIDNSGSGAVSQGDYQLKLDVTLSQDTIVDTSGTPLDGDGDGQAGGNFNYWFRTAAPQGVAAAGEAKTVFVDKGFTGTGDGSVAAPFNSLPAAQAAVTSGDVIRVVGSVGVDGDLTTVADNPAYEIGRGGVGNAVLSDGLTLEVPQGVSMMVDAGAIFKLRGSRVSVGSLNASIDKSLSSFQVLGTPTQPVYFTSFNNEAIGVDSNPLATTPGPGDWGGIDFHNDVDRAEGRGDFERQGIFLNHASFADITYGGGQVTVAAGSPTVNPFNLSQARPTLLNNTIRFSADAAISADPDSLEETRFTHPQYQLVESFRPDYSRVGPDLRGNVLLDNSTNGLFVKTSTVAGVGLTTLGVSARLDDTDITHVLGENLIVSGTAGGPILEEVGPDVSLVVQTQQAGGSLTAGSTVAYKVTAVDINGNEGVPSAATPTITLTDTSVRLERLPQADGDFVARRLWRSVDAGDFELVARLDGDTTTYVDTGAKLGAVLANPNATQLQRGRYDGRLQIDPGIVVKTAGARIEAGIGAQIIAEGTAENPIIFTSRFDDTYGAGGTFDTNRDGTATNPGAGDWGGVVARHLSKLSLDNVLVAYGGGVASVSGEFAGFNAVEVHQAEARIANSRFIMNASGQGGSSHFSRDGRGPNDQSVIFVTGSQPVIVNNVFQDNSVTNTAAISINANALNTASVVDLGRQTGPSDRVTVGYGNRGPLVDGNLLAGNGINGMRVRGQTLTTESVWDDSDIVHVLQSEIIVPDFHTVGGLRLQSRSDESLVVKLEGNGAGFTALGRPLDITDRIGGTLQIVGAPGFPVVLTSLADDTVGAGFDPTGRALVDTNNDGNSLGSPGDWRSVRLDVYANDRNVAIATELETDQIQETGSNDVVGFAQDLGTLAGTLSGGDENLRLGFTVDGAVAAPQDLDVYSFQGTAGSAVWIDIDHTSGSLDAVVELIDGDGNILAQSDNSLRESAGTETRFVSSDISKISPDQVLSLDSEFFAPANSFAPTTDRDLYSVNPLDPGLRVVLPGALGATNQYFVRVRSSNVGPGQATSRLQDPTLEREGLTQGAYRLQVRMQQADEVAGSTVQYADIRFAQIGIEAYGMPGSSPLLGQLSTSGSGTDLGNIVNSDRGSVSVAGELTAPGGVDLYTFTVQRDSTQVIDPTDGATHIATTFDIDYADGFGRPDTALWVFDSAGELVLIGTDSNIADDRGAPGQGADVDDLSRGSAGSRDAFIGTAELPPGQYTVAVTNGSQVPAVFDQFQQAAATNPLLRLEPISSVNRISVDRFDDNLFEVNQAPQQVAFSTDIEDQHHVSWTLADVTTYVVRNQGAGSRLMFANANTGALDADISNFVRVNDAAISPDGRLVGYQIPNGLPVDAATGNFHLINSVGAPGNAIPNNASTQSGNHGIQTLTTEQTGANAFAVQQRTINNAQQGDGFNINALTFFTNDSDELKMFGVGSRAIGSTFNVPALDANNGVVGINGVSFNTTNIVYKLDPNTGAAINPGTNPVQDRQGVFRANGNTAGTQKIEFGRFLSGTAATNFTDGTVTGLTEIDGQLFAVSNLGELFVANLGSGDFGFTGQHNGPATAPGEFSDGLLPATVVVDPETNAPVSFTGLTAGPRNLEQGRFADMLFGITTDGTIYAFDTAGVLQPVFPGYNYKIQSTDQSLGGATSIDFSPLDVNLWHVSQRRDGEAGHGRTEPFDVSELGDKEGNNVLYFGFNDPNNGPSQIGDWTGNYDVAAYRDSYDLPGGAHGAIVSNPLDLSGYSPDDQPMLYFNYLLETSDTNSDLNDGNNRMQDAFRVYGAGEDGQWALLATNNTPRDNGLDRASLNGFVDELDLGGGAATNFDAFGNPVKTQEVFDGQGWRQARTSLAALAGQENVRLRFEFSTGATFRTGDALLGGSEIVAVAGHKLNDGSYFKITPVDGVTAVAKRAITTDLGLGINVPAGASLTDGVSTISIDGTDVVFSLTSNAGNNVQYTATDSAAQVAANLAARLPAILGIPVNRVTTNAVRANVLNIAGLADASFATPNYSVSADLASEVITSLPGSAGAVLEAPDGATLQFLSGFAPVQITVAGQAFTFSANNGAGNNILFTPNDTSAQVATAILNKLQDAAAGGIGFSPQDVQIYNDSVVKIFNAPAGVYTDNFGIIVWEAEAFTADQSMTNTQVRDRIRVRLATTYNNPLSVPTANAVPLDAWPVATPAATSSVINVHKFDLSTSHVFAGTSVSDVGATTSRTGDAFGVQDSGTSTLDERALNNAFEGVYLDDIIVGFAERGEMVFDAGANTGFANNAQYDLTNYNIPQVETGRYQLTVRASADYGTTDTVTGELVNFGPFGRSWDTNDRLAQQVGIQVADNAAGQILDGSTFTLSDGGPPVTFEYDVVAGPNDTASGVVPGNIAVVIDPSATPTDIARAIRDAINSPTAQASLELSASVQGEASLGGADANPLSSTVVALHGPASSDASGQFAFPAESFLQPVVWGSETEFGEDHGDSERERPQGQVLLVGNTVTDSSQFGIVAAAGARNQTAIGGDVGDRPYPGAPINLPTPNTSRLAPGVVIVNNIVASNGAGGIRIAGDAQTDSPAQIARVINNTVYGGGAGTGILIENTASPTLLNNIFASNNIGVQAPGGSTAVLGANLYQDNGSHTVNVGLGSFPEVLAASDPLFVSTTNRRFYLAAGSKAIDSSLEALQERPALAQVKNSIDLPASPMLSPDRDVTGQLRVDDPTVNSPAGLGSNVFKDRGAVDRSDFTGLEAVILQPQDNDSLDIDSDRTETYIQLESGLVEFFSILLRDNNGTGPDPATVVSSAVTLTENGRLLVDGVDYVFGYNANSRTIQLTPVAGIWRTDSVYEITLANEDSFTLNPSAGIASADGDAFTIDHAAGSTIFELDDDGLVTPGAIAIPFDATTSEYEITLKLLSEINSAGLGVRTYLQGDGALAVVGAAGASATGMGVSVTRVSGITDLAGNPLFANRVSSLTQFTIVMPEVGLDYGDAGTASGANTYPTVMTDASGKRTIDAPRHAILPVDAPNLALGGFADAENDGQPDIYATGDDVGSLTASTTIPGAVIAPTGVIVLQAAAATAAIEGQTFAIVDPNIQAVTFEFDTDPAGGNVTAGNYRVPILASASADDVAAAVRDAVNDAVAAGLLDGLIAAAQGDTVNLGGGRDHQFFTAPVLTRLPAGEFDLTLPAAGMSDGDSITIADSLGNVLTFELDDNPTGGASSVVAGSVPVTVDLSVATSQDIADAFGEAINTTVAARRLNMAPVVVSGLMLEFSANDETGVSFGGLFNSNLEPVPVTVTSTGSGVLDVWFDWNADGDFQDAGERVATDLVVQAGENIVHVQTPDSAVIGATMSRFRLSMTGNLSGGGLGIGGEVEDHRIEIVSGQPPVAVDDNYTVVEDGFVDIAAPGILANDTDADSPAITVLDQNPLTPEIDPVQDVAHGTLVLNADGSFSYTPDPDYFGTDVFVYNASDARLQSALPATVTITVTPVNDRPTAIDDEITVLEDELIVRPGRDFTANDYKGIFGTPSQTNELGQDLTVVDAVIIHPDPAVYGGSVSVVDNEITYTPPAHYNNQIDGPALVELTIRDSGVAGADEMPLEHSSTLTINLTAVNDAPEFTMPATTGTSEDSGDVVVDSFLTDLRPGPTQATDEATGPAVAFEDQQTSYTVTALDPSLFAVQPAIAGTADANPGQLTYTLAADVNTVTPFPEILVEVIAVDTGASGGTNMDVNTSDPQTFTILPTPINDAPEFEIPTETDSLEDEGVISVAGFLTDLRPGPTTALDEATQVLTVSIAADPNAFTATGYPSIDLMTGDLTYETAPHVNQFTGQSFVVDVTVIDDGGTNLGGVDRTTKAFTINVTELNDAPEYDMPTVTSAFQEDPTVDPMAPTVVPGFASNILPGPPAATDEGPAREDQQVSFAVRALDESLFDPAFLPAINADGTLTYRLNPDVNQMVPFPVILVEVIASDTGLDDGGTNVPRNINTAEARTFTILPDPINDAPEFTIPDTLDATEDSGTITVADFMTDARPGPITALDELAGQTISVTVEALDPTAFATQPTIVLDPMLGTGELTYELAADVNIFTGHDLRVRVTVQDDGGVANPGDVDTTVKTFALNVAPINDAPSFDLPVTEVTFLEDVEEVTGINPTVVPGFATNILAGPTTALDENDNPATRQSVSFVTVSVSDPSLFAVQPRILPNGDLTFETAQQQNGTAEVVVHLLDDGVGPETGNGDDNQSRPDVTFTINITPVNDAPEFTIPDTASSQEDQGFVSIPGFATGLRPGPIDATDEADQGFTVAVTAADPSAFSVQPAIGADGTLTFQTGPDVNSLNANLTVTVVLTDTGDASPAPNTNTSRTGTFTIETADINDEPTFDLSTSTVEVIEDVEEFEGTTITSLPAFATNMLPGPLTATDEANQILNFEVVSVSAPELFDQQPVISQSGELTFETAQHKNGKAVVVVRLIDDGTATPAPNDNTSQLKTFTISITPINDAPEFELPNTVTVDEDAGLVSRSQFATSVRRGPAGSDDENSQLIAFEVTAMDPTSFTIQPSIGVDGTLSFQTAPHVNSLNADLRVTATLRDSGADAPEPNVNVSDTKTFSLIVTPVNDAPTTDAFEIIGQEDTALVINADDVLVGDIPGPTPDELDQSLRITQVARTSVGGGTVTPIFGDPQDPSRVTSINYLPPVNLAGIDEILYVVTDDGSPERSGTGTITVVINGINDAPQFIRGEDVVVPEDAGDVEIPTWATNILAGPPSALDELVTQTVTFNVVATDASLFATQPTVSSDGTLSFTPAADANGTTTVTVQAMDDGPTGAPNVNTSAAQTFLLRINPVNDAPVFTAGGNVAVDEDSGAYSDDWATGIAPAGGLLDTPQTATDEAGQGVDFQLSVDRPELFSVQPAISSTGELTFTPESNAFGDAVIVVTLVDRGPANPIDENTSTPATLTVSINPTNDRPIANDDSYTTNEDSVLEVPASGLLGNDTDFDIPLDSLQVVAQDVVSDSGVTVSLNADGSFRYDASSLEDFQALQAGQSIFDRFTYTVEDTAGSVSLPATVTIRVDGADDAPVANDDTYAIGAGNPVELTVLSNDTDVDSTINPQSISVTANPAFGTVTVLGIGVIRYTPDAGFRGSDSFRYTVRDSAGNVSNEAIVTVTVNSAPTAASDSATTFKGEPVDINVLANDVDQDGTIDPSTVSIEQSSPNGLVEVQGDGSVRFTPTTGFTGPTTFRYSVRDNVGTPSNVATVTVQVLNSKWQNPSGFLDVNADGSVSPIDALIVINYLNSGAETNLTLTDIEPAPFLDPTGDEQVAPNDVLAIINFLNQNSGGGAEGEGVVDVAPEQAGSIDYAMMVTPTQMIETVGPQIVREIQDELDNLRLAAMGGNMGGDMVDSDSMNDAAGRLYDVLPPAVADDTDDVASCLHDELNDSAATNEEALDDFFSGYGPQLP
ncbi:MAG: hypothetical protein Aurels2KO_40950 [Aureliella sp.]